MAILASQGSATSSSAALLTLPPGPCSVVLTNSGTATAYVGAGGTAVTTGNGMPIPTGTVAWFNVPAPTAATPLWVVTGSGTSVVGYLVTQADR